MKKVVLVVIALALLGIIGYRVSAKIKLDAEVAERAKSQTVPAVAVAAPTMRAMGADVRVTGTVRPIEEVDIFSKASGRIVAIKVELGDAVKAGQVLALVEQEVASLQLKQASAALEAARANLANAEANAQSAESLGKSQNIADVQLTAARAGLTAAQAQVRQAQAAAGLAREGLENTRITSPIDGVVTRKSVNVGAMVGGSPMALFRVENLSSLKLETSVDEKEVALVKTGQIVDFSVDAFPGETFTGTIQAMSPSLDAATRRATVEVAVDNGAGKLFGNVFAKGAVRIDGAQQVLALPRAAVVGTEASPTVFVVEGDVARMRPVELGATDGVYVAVRSGVGEADKVVVTGQTLLRDGMTVSVQASGAQAQD